MLIGQYKCFLPPFPAPEQVSVHPQDATGPWWMMDMSRAPSMAYNQPAWNYIHSISLLYIFVTFLGDRQQPIKMTSKTGFILMHKKFKTFSSHKMLSSKEMLSPKEGKFTWTRRTSTHQLVVIARKHVSLIFSGIHLCDFWGVSSQGKLKNI